MENLDEQFWLQCVEAAKQENATIDLRCLDFSQFYLNTESEEAENPISVEHPWLYEAIGQTSLVFSLVLSAVGICTNIASIVMFSQKRKRRHSSIHFLIALSAADLSFLLSLLVVWIKSFVAPQWNRYWLCALSTYVSYVASFQSAWFIVAVSVERLIAVTFPLKCHLISTVRRAKMSICVITIVAFAFCAWVPFAVEITTAFASGESRPTASCDKVADFRFYVMMNVTDTVFTFSIPCALILVLNVAIGYKLIRSSNARKKLVTMSQSSSTKPAAASSPLLEKGRAPKCYSGVRKTELYEFNMLSSTSCSYDTSSSHARRLAQRLEIETRSECGSFATASTLASPVSSELSFKHFLKASLSSSNPMRPEGKHGLGRQTSLFVPVAPSLSTTGNAIEPSNIRRSISSYQIRERTISARTTLMKPRRHNRRELRITRMLVIVAVVHLLLNLPSYLSRMLTHAFEGSFATRLIIVTLSYMLFYLQYCINFFLYSLSGNYGLSSRRRLKGMLATLLKKIAG